MSNNDSAFLSDRERARVVDSLVSSRQEFLSHLDRVQDGDWDQQPSADIWSAAHICEHLILAERRLFTIVTTALKSAPDPAWAGDTTKKTDFIERVILNRRRKVKAPEEIAPKGEMQRLEAIGLYRKNRERSLRFAQETDQPLKEHTLVHPFPIFGKLNAFQWLLYIGLHNSRHNQQLAELLARST